MADELYHYTGAAGLFGISGAASASGPGPNVTLWASNARSMNDASEGTYVRDLILDVLVPHIEAGQKRAIALKDLLAGANTNYLLAPEIYLVCLSSARDLLSQWRGYTSHGDAFMLHFSRSGIEDALAGPTSRLEKCGYPEDLTGLTMDRQLEQIVRGAPDTEYRLSRFHGVYDDDPYRPSGGYTSADLYPVEAHMGAAVPAARQLMAANKHPAFEEEQEWRIIVESEQYDPQVSVRIAPRGLIDYLEVALPREVISGITVGPGSAQAEAARTAQLLFPHLTLKQVHLSRTPLVGP